MLRHKLTCLTLIAALFICTDLASAQRGGRGGGDRGGDRGGRTRGGGDRGDRGGNTGGRSWNGGDRGGNTGGRSWSGTRGGGGDRGSSRGGGRPDFDPSQVGTRIAGYFDRNKDGYLDQGELGRMPSSFKERFNQGGIDTSRGISVNDFGKKTASAIRERMESRQRDQESRDRGERPERRGDNSSTSSSGRSVFKLSQRQNFIQELPAEYQPGDSDKDNQIALFEWAAWKRSDMFEFFEFDANQDGFLTARELEGEKSDAERGIVMKRDRLAVATSRGGGGSRVRSANSPNAKSTAPGGQKRTAEQTQRDKSRATFYFSALDRDRDGTISEEEWERSRRVKGMFEKAGIPVKSMSSATFASSYLKAVAKSGDSAGDSRQQSWGGDRGGSTNGRSNWGGGDRGSTNGRSSWGGDRGGNTGGRTGGRGDRGGDSRGRGR